MKTPTLETIKNTYNELVEIMKDVKTIDQCKEIEQKYRLTIEINGDFIENYVKNGGTNEDIEWIRVEHYKCIDYIYFFNNGPIYFDVWTDDFDTEFICDTTIDKLDEAYEIGIKWVKELLEAYKTKNIAEEPMTIEINGKKSIDSLEEAKELRNKKSISAMTTSELFTELSEDQKKELFQMFLSDCIYKDVESLLAAEKYAKHQLDDEDIECVATEVANKFVYNNRMDLENAYWDNLTCLIDEELEQLISIGTQKAECENAIQEDTIYFTLSNGNSGYLTWSSNPPENSESYGCVGLYCYDLFGNEIEGAELDVDSEKPLKEYLNDALELAGYAKDTSWKLIKESEFEDMLEKSQIKEQQKEKLAETSFSDYKVKLNMSEEYTVRAESKEHAEFIARDKLGCDYYIDSVEVNELGNEFAKNCEKLRNRDSEEKSPHIPYEYYKVSDGMFTYYVNKENGQKKLQLDKNDICTERRIDDFQR